ncbi:hydrolase, partial [Bordetella bronchiseptica]
MTNPGDGAAGAVDCATLDHWRPRLAAIAAAAGQDDAAHDLGHLRRVWDAARAMLQAHPEADALVVLAASYLHDLVNLPKNHPVRHLASRQAAAAARER